MNDRQTLLKKVAQYLAGLVMLIGTLVLVGWQFDIEFLKRPMANLVAMNPMTAVAFILSGLSLLMLNNSERKKNRSGSIVLAVVVMLIGALRIMEETTSIDLNIDERLFAHKLITDAIGNISNRMGANAAFNFLLLGLALLLSGYDRRKRLANNISFLVLAMALFSFLGYIYYVTEFHSMLVYLPISVHAVFCFVLMAVAVLCTNSRQGFMRVFTSEYAGGTIARRLIPAIIFIPVLLGFIRLWVYWKQPFSVELGVAALISCIVIVFFALIWYLSTVLDKSEATRVAMQEQLKQFEYFFNHSNDFSSIANTEGYFEIVNPSFKKVLGYFQNELSENPFLNFVHPDDIPATLQEYEKLKSGAPVINFVNRYRKKDDSYLWFDWNASPNQVTGKLYCIARDITERKKAEDALNKLNEELEQRVKERTEEITKANRLYAFLSAINQSIVHIDNEKELLENACRIASVIGGFKVARIGLLDEDGKFNVTSVYSDEITTGFLERYTGVDYNSPELRDSPTAQVLVTGRYLVVNDTQRDLATPALKEVAQNLGLKSIISLPIKKFGKVIGAFALNSVVENFFDQEEINLLEEAVGDISFALEVFEKEKMREVAESKLERSELKLKEAQVLAKTGSWEIDMIHNNLYWSDEQFNLLGLNKEEVVPTNELFFSMVHPQDAENVISQFNNTMQGFENSSSEFRLIRKDGAIIHAFCEWKFEFDGHQKPVRIYGITQDITERKKFEEQLALFASIVNSSDDAIISKSLDGIITSWNHGAEKVLGYSAAEIIGRHISLLIPENLQGEEIGILDKIRLGGSIDHYETQRIRKDGKIIYASLTVSPIKDALGHITGASKILRDTTEKKEAELEILKLNDELEERVAQRTVELTEANKGLEAFSSTVSHDLRAPVRAVTSFAKIIQQEFGDRMGLKEKELFGYIEDSGKRMSAIIDDLLKLAKYGNEKLKLEPVNMTRLVEGIWLNISRTTSHHAKLDLQELLNVQVDISMLQQVVVNLLSNAIKYSSKKDKPIVSVWSEKTNGNVTFYFKDNGAGFDMKNYDRLFGAFQRFHSLKEFEGTGVGLTLVKRIIEKHGGTVGAEAKVGEGATFYFTLPTSS